MIYNILKVIGLSIIIISYFGGFLFFIFIGEWISEKINLYFYKKKLEITAKYINSIYNNNKNNILYIDYDALIKRS